VVTKPVVEKNRKGSFRKLFQGGDIRSAWDYVLADVIVPSIKKLVVDTISNGTSRTVYGENGPRPGVGNRPYTPYANQYATRTIDRVFAPSTPRQAMPSTSIDDIVIPDAADAETVLLMLLETVSDHGRASVADFKELVGLPTTYVDNNWGWTSLTGSEVRQTREGYVLELPRAITLKD
jgi:hypothetical protein